MKVKRVFSAQYFVFCAVLLFLSMLAGSVSETRREAFAFLFGSPWFPSRVCSSLLWLHEVEGKV